MGGAFPRIDYMKSRLVESNADRLGRIEAGERCGGRPQWQQGNPPVDEPRMVAQCRGPRPVEETKINRLKQWRD